MQLSVRVCHDGTHAEGGRRVAYDVARNQARSDGGAVDGLCVVWSFGDGDEGAALSVPLDLDGADGWFVRCDRVDFPPGGVAYRHTHPGPGIRVLLHGSIRIDSAGESRTYGPLEPWFESGPEPVFAQASATLDTAFARVMLVPDRWQGQRTISYVDPADADKPKTQRATVFLEEPLYPS